MTDLRHELADLLVEPGAQSSPAATNPYASPADESTEPVRSDPYAALRQDAEAREANQYNLPSISSLSSLRQDAEPDPTPAGPPPEPVLSEAVLRAAGLLEPATDPSVPTLAPVPMPLPAESTSLYEGTFADFLTHEAPAPDSAPALSEEPEADLTEIFAGLELNEPVSTEWRRGDDDVIGSGTQSRSEKRRSLRLRRKAA